MLLYTNIDGVSKDHYTSVLSFLMGSPNADTHSAFLEFFQSGSSSIKLTTKEQADYLLFPVNWERSEEHT
ncbi:MAG: hypothetical protein RIB86_10355, partial [Imperialibacter sp.]